MTEESTKKTTTRVTKAERVDLSQTSAPWLKASGVKVCSDCGERVCSRPGEDGNPEVFCPANKKDCAFVKVAST